MDWFYSVGGKKKKKKTTHFFPGCTHPGQSVPKECVTARNNPEMSHIMPFSFPFPVVSLYLLFLCVKLARENSMALKVSAKCFTHVCRQLAYREASRTANGRQTYSFTAIVE